MQVERLVSTLGTLSQNHLVMVKQVALAPLGTAGLDVFGPYFPESDLPAVNCESEGTPLARD